MHASEGTVDMKKRTSDISDMICSTLERESVLSLKTLGNRHDALSFERLNSDGSMRKFIRVCLRGEPLCIAVMPPTSEKKDMAEFRSALDIGRHLHSKGVPVPELIAANERFGLLIFEDLGNTRLHDKRLEDRKSSIEFYQETVKVLAHMQLAGADGFAYEWCYDSPTYNQKVMLERESGYFIDAFLKGTLFYEPVAGLLQECEELAEKVMSSWQPLFLHRDFQSRNIMVHRDRIRIIDFQAGRIGPPGYDIASLLIDPYAGLSDAEQDDLFQLYIGEMSKRNRACVSDIKTSYPYLALQRNMQIIGAFAFLFSRRNKSFFKQYLLPSLIMLQNRLADTAFDDFPLLRQTVSTAILEYRRSLR